MKRVVAATLCGFAIAFACASIGYVLSTFTNSKALQWLLWIPVGWPKLILELILPSNAVPIRDEYRVAVVIYMIVANVLLYGSLCYFVLLGLSLSGKSKRAKSSVPPPPTVPQ